MRVVAELQRVGGPETALYIMSNLPVVDWHELASKADLHAELASLREEMATKADLRVEMSTLRGEMYQALNAQTKWFVGTNVALVGITLTAARLMF